MLRIWGRTTSSNVQKVLWCCAELGLAFDRTDWGGPFGGNKDPAYLAMNPNGRVPTIEDGDLVVWESNTIMRYLCATRDGARLHPLDLAARTHVERWMDWQLAHLAPSHATMTQGYLRQPPEKRDPVALEAARQQGAMMWEIVEAQLTLGPHVAGEAFTLADICLGVFAHRWHYFPIERPSLPRVRAWYEQIAQRPAFQAHVAAPPS